MKTLKFDNIQEYKNYLMKVIPDLAQDREYNIFMHCVTGNTSYFIKKSDTLDEDIAKKVAGIMKNGLNLDGAQDYGNYGSINGTAKFFGNSRNVKVLNIVNYDYSNRSNKVNSFIIAIPQYVNVYGEMVEFSSYKGSMKHASQHVKDCLFDLIKDSYLPIEFIWAHQIVDKHTGEVVLNLNNKHLSLLDENKKDEFLSGISKKCEQKLDYCRSQYGVTDYEDIFRSMTDEHMSAIDDFLNEP